MNKYKFQHINHQIIVITIDADTLEEAWEKLSKKTRLTRDHKKKYRLINE